MEISNAHLRYLLAIYDLSMSAPEVSSAGVARLLGVTKPSVTIMTDALLKRELVKKERYGKIMLTELGRAEARRFGRKVAAVRRRLPRLGIRMTEQEMTEAACLLAGILSEEALEPDGSAGLPGEDGMIFSAGGSHQPSRG